MKIIPLTKKFPFSENTTIYVNTERIIAFFRNRDNDENETVIKLDGEDEWMVVAESVTEVMKRIRS